LYRSPRTLARQSARHRPSSPGPAGTRTHPQALTDAIMHAKQSRFPLSLRLSASMVALLLTATAAHTTDAEEYRLGPQDKVRVKVYEWRASRDEIYEWKALNDVFIVGARGKLS